MKKIITAMGMVLCITLPALAEDGVKISGSVEIQYRNSSDNYASSGDDKIQPEELYIQLEKEVAENVGILIKLDGADMNNKTGNKSTHKVVEEAQVIFRNVGDRPLTLVFGKDEMPFGQDYERFLLNSVTHDFEIDKVWGVHGIYKLYGFGSVAAAFFERDAENKKDVGLTDSFAIKLKADKLVDNLSVEVSYATVGKDESTAEVDEDRVSLGAKFKIADITLHGEYTSFSDYSHVSGRDLGVMLVGADYRIENLLFKVRHEASDDDNANEEDGRTAIGVSYYFSKKAFVTAEWEKTTYEGSTPDTDKLLLGAQFKF